MAKRLGKVLAGYKKRWRGMKSRNRGLAVAGAVSLLVVVAVGVLWSTGVVAFPRIEALFSPSAGDGSVVLVEPSPGSRVAAGTTFQGTMDADGIVYVWVKGVNFAVPAESTGRSWSYTYTGGLSGERTLAFGLVTGVEWGEPTEARFLFTEGVAEAESPSGFAKVFQPVVNVAKAVVAFVTQGSSGDLDDNGVPDRWQGGPVSPARGVPYLNLVIVGVVVLVGTGGVVYAVRSKQIHEYLLRRKMVAARSKRAAEAAKLKEARLRVDVAKEKLRVIGKLKGQQLGAVERLKREQLRAVTAVQRDALAARRATAPEAPRGGRRWFFRRKGRA